MIKKLVVLVISVMIVSACSQKTDMAPLLEDRLSRAGIADIDEITPSAISGLYEVHYTHNGQSGTFYSDGNYLLTGTMSIAGEPAGGHSGGDLSAMQIKNRMRELKQPFTVQRVVPSEIEGLYEMHVNEQGTYKILYTDGYYIITDGNLLGFDGTNITQLKMDETRLKIDVSSALTVINGAGSKEVIMITDPECPYCARADVWFEDADTKRKILFLPLDFHRGARPISEHILCSDDPEAEYKAIMKHSYTYFTADHGLKGKGLLPYLEAQGVTIKSCGQGKKQLAEMEKAIADVGITGTPMFIIDGMLIKGATQELYNMIK